MLDAAFVEAGLRPEAVHRATYTWPAPPADWFREHAKLAYGWSPVWRMLDDAQRAAFAEEAAALAADLPPEGISSTALIDMARKAG